MVGHLPPRGGAEEVAAISNTLPNIQQPEIGRADFPAEDIAKLSYFRDLALLWLAGSSTSDEAVRGLLRLPKLAEVDLKINNRITDIGLAALAGHKTLKEIVCSKALGVTDSGLLNLTKLKSLQRIELNDCPNITTDGIEAFKKARPDVTVRK